MKVTNKGAFRHEIQNAIAYFSNEENLHHNKSIKNIKKDLYSYDDDDDDEYDNRVRKKGVKPSLHIRLKR